METTKAQQLPDEFYDEAFKSLVKNADKALLIITPGVWISQTTCCPIAAAVFSYPNGFTLPVAMAYKIYGKLFAQSFIQGFDGHPPVNNVTDINAYDINAYQHGVAMRNAWLRYRARTEI